MIRNQRVIVSFLVSWSVDPVYAEVNMVQDEKNADFYRRYRFSYSLATAVARRASAECTVLNVLILKA